MSGTHRLSSPAQARILLVDDNKSGLAARKAVLEELGHRIATATGGEDALEAFAPGRFDMVVTDFRMPRMDGGELIRRLRGIEPGIPIIILSAYVDTLGLTEGNTGADVVLPKSANEVAHLIRAVNRILRRKTAKKPPGAQSAALKAKSKGA